MALLYAFWGITTIFLFWGALIRATREWGGDTSQGTAFGILEGGRGVAAAVFASLMVIVLAYFMPDDPTMATDAERRAAFQMVILGYSAIAIVIGVITWFTIPDPEGDVITRRNPFPNMKLVIREPVVWAQAAVVVCAYCGYKAVGYYSLYAVQVVGLDEVEGARIASYGAYIRPFAALSAGLIADRFDATRSIGVTFTMLAVVYGVLASVSPDQVGVAVIYGNAAMTLLGVFALRGIYYALLQETQTPRRITGSAVGMIALVGYTPEIFFAPIAGRILDASPGLAGFQNMFLLLATMSAAGVVVVLWLLWLKRNKLSFEPVT